ncbi:MAG: SMP-30/gluconolactonase/LRE family protein [Anaerolineales bacterium]
MCRFHEQIVATWDNDRVSRPSKRLRLTALTFSLAMSTVTLAGCGPSQPVETPTIDVILTGLENPRGIAFGPDGELFVAEAGTGFDAVEPTERTGKLTVFTDHNGDGDYDDAGEAERWFSHLPTYNALQFFGTLRDEVNGPADVLIHRDGRLFLSVDGGLDDIALYEISSEGRIGRNLYTRSNMNGIAFDRAQEHIYVAASTANQLVEISLNGETREIVTFPALESSQQAVPAGLSVDPRTGEVLVALFSGTAVDRETGEVIPFVLGDSKVVRVDPATGAIADEITGLTAAVDVTVDEAGNVFVVEMTSDYADLLPKLFDVFDPEASPLHGGYLRYSGRVTFYPAAGGSSRVLAAGLDMPTNITPGPDGALYISTGEGTPGRPIPGPDGPTAIVGEILRITDFAVGADD